MLRAGILYLLCNILYFLKILILLSISAVFSIEIHYLREIICVLLYVLLNCI